MIPGLYDPEIKAAVAEYWTGQDWRWFKAQLYQESHMDPTAISPAGARGLAQFMPETWKDMCDRFEWGDASPYDTALSIRAGAYYMASLARSWTSRRPKIDQWDLARASYNAGFGNILKAQEAAGGALLYADIIAALPLVTGENSRETIEYVKRIHRWYTELSL